MFEMSVGVVALIFIFIARLRFPSDLPMVQVLHNRYDIDLVKNVRKLEKIGHKCRKLL